MPEQTDIPISSFPDAESISNADKVTGIKNNLNTNFTFSSILSWFVNAVKSAFVPVSRTVNGKTLDTNVTLNASDVGARPDTWIPSASAVGAIPASEKGVPLGVPVLDIDGKIPDNQLDLEDKANQSQLATEETGSTASRAYAAGEYFCWNGLLYRATAAISVGQSFTPGTNCYQTTVMDMVPPRIIGGDLNDYTTPGLYMWTDAVASMPSNTPIVAQSVMIVLQASQAGRVCQIVFAHNATRNGAYYRWLFSNAWTSWYTIG